MEPNTIKDQYCHSNLFEKIVEAIEQSGNKHKGLTHKTISIFDEFHVMGRVVTTQLIDQLNLNENHKVLDVGCGLGGPCRMIANRYKCVVTGIDLSGEHIRSARLLSKALNMSHLTDFKEADALNTPFVSSSFDVVITQHVQMNIARKDKFFREIHRVLKPGGVLLYYDVFGQDSESLYYPLPWADNSSVNHLLTTHSYSELLIKEGFRAEGTTALTDKGVQFLTTFLERTKETPSLFTSQRILMGDNAHQKVSNIHRCLKERKIELQSGIYRKLRADKQTD